MTDNQKLSIIIPVYNMEAYISECLDSILNQAYENCEILIVNDGSSDGSAAIIDKYAGRDQRINVFHIENQGVSNARNMGIERSSGAYLSFVDPDDWIDRDMYTRMVQALVTNNANLVVCGYVHEPASTKRNPRSYGFPVNMVLDRDSVIFDFVFSPFSNGPCNKVYMANIILNNGLRFPEGLVKGQDRFFNYYYLDQIEKILIMDFTPYHYRKVSTSSVHCFRPDLFDVEFQAEKELEEHLDRWGFIEPRQIERRKRNFIQFVVRNIENLWHPGNRWNNASRIKKMIDMKQFLHDSGYSGYLKGTAKEIPFFGRFIYRLFTMDSFVAISLFLTMKKRLTIHAEI